MINRKLEQIFSAPVELFNFWKVRRQASYLISILSRQSPGAMVKRLQQTLVEQEGLGLDPPLFIYFIFSPLKLR